MQSAGSVRQGGLAESMWVLSAPSPLSGLGSDSLVSGARGEHGYVVVRAIWGTPM